MVLPLALALYIFLQLFSMELQLFFPILGTSVCSGDSGGGLVFKFDGRYYVTGIVSLSPQASTGGCDTQQYGLYTKVGTYISDFIIKTESQFRP
jgi:secreted trypsin-like serine protease